MKNVARGLENKIIELQQKLTEKVKFIDSSHYSLNMEQLKCCFHFKKHIFIISKPLF